MRTVLIINTIICVLGVLAGIMVAAGSVISIATMKVSWASWLVPAAFLIPLAFAISGTGACIANGQDASGLTIALRALPWTYGLAFVLAMLVAFRS